VALNRPYVGPFKDGMSFGVHRAVRVWYSPEIADWLCAGRPEGGLPDGAMIIKEMAPIDPTVLGIDPNASCMVIETTPDAIEPSSWTVLVRAPAVSHDGWYWANPTGSGDGNPPILTKSSRHRSPLLRSGPPAPEEQPTLVSDRGPVPGPQDPRIEARRYHHAL
jgi:hypothetical protein